MEANPPGGEVSAAVSSVLTGGQATVSPVMKMLQEFMHQAERGELASVAVAFIRKDGAAAVNSTPMSAVNLNHLLMLFSRKVARAYDRALAAAEQPHSPTGAMRPQSPQTAAAQLPRKVRRQVAAAQRKAAKKKGRLSGPPLPTEEAS